MSKNGDRLIYPSQPGRPTPGQRGPSFIAPTPPPSKGGKPKKKGARRLGPGALVVVLILALAITFIVVQGKDEVTYHPDLIMYGPYVRDGSSDKLPDQVPDPNVIFSEQNLRKMWSGGKGLNVPLVIEKDPEHGDSTYRDSLYLDPSPTYVGHPETRRPIVEKLVPVWKAKIGGWARHRVKFYNLRFLVDVTNGVDGTLRNLIDERFDALKLPDLVKEDSLRFCAGAISDQDFLDVPCTDMTAVLTAAQKQEKLNEIQASVERLKGRVNPTTQTSLAVMLANNLRVGHGTKRRYILISDGVENAPGYTLDFYHDPGAVMDSTRWEATAAALERPMKMPDDLRGTTIDWYAPKVALDRRALMRRSQQFWEWLLEKRGAEVNIH